MPAIIFEDTALNYTSTASSSGIPIYAQDLSSNYPIFNTSNGPEDFWPLLPTEDSSYHEFAATVFGYFDDKDENFGSPLPFDASENGLWNGRFVPPPPRPPFLEDSILADGITTCDLCSWARPTRTPFINEEALQKATQLWPFVLFAVLSLIIGATLTILICQRKRKKSADRNETNAVQWWSRNKQRPHMQSGRRNNIYTGNPADSIRGLHPNILQNHRPNAAHHNNNNNNHEAESCRWPNVTSCVVSS